MSCANDCIPCDPRAAIQCETSPKTQFQPMTWPPDGPGHPCQCKNYCECKEIERFQPKMRYIQPERPPSYAPQRGYKKPDANMDSDTVYKRSYYEHDPASAANARGAQIRQKDNLAPSGDFSTNTTQRMSYPGWPCADAAQAILPRGHKLMGDGPMQSQTTQRHDYTPKRYSKETPFIPCGQIKRSDKPMEDTSTMFASYQAPDPCEIDPAKSFRPERLYQKPDAQFADGTVQKMSYVPWPIHDKEEFPWAAKPKYKPPASPMEGNTIYNTSYMPTDSDGPRGAIKPADHGNVITSNTNFSDGTIYKDSYLPVGQDIRPEPFKAVDNLHTSDSQFANDTTQRMSYPGWPCADAAQAILPRGHKLMGDGPMQSQTTQRHDFTPKRYSKETPFIPCGQIKRSDKPMEDTSTMTASYQAPDPCELDPAMSFRPERLYQKPDAQFSDGTVQKMSYVPWPIHDKEEFPWAAKPKYKNPTSPMEGNTVYNTSYEAPGEFVPADCDPNDKSGCYCVYPGQCFAPVKAVKADCFC